MSTCRPVYLQQRTYLVSAGTAVECQKRSLPPFAERALRNIGVGTPLVDFDIGRPDHLAPLLGFGGDESSEIGGRACKRRRTQIGEPRFHLGFGKSNVYLPVQLVDDFGGCVLWCGNPEPITSL